MVPDSVLKSVMTAALHQGTLISFRRVRNSARLGRLAGTNLIPREPSPATSIRAACRRKARCEFAVLRRFLRVISRDFSISDGYLFFLMSAILFQIVASILRTRVFRRG
jgi:hypothetical protein